MPRVHFKQSDQTLSCETGTYLLDLCEEHDAPIQFSCRAGACGACVIDVGETPNGLNPMTEREKRTLTTIGSDLSRNRLACINRVMDDLEIREATTQTSERAREAGIRPGFEAEVLQSKSLSDNVREVTFKVIQPAIITFLPGQYLSFTIDDHEHIRRSYSIASTPADRSHVTICVRAVSGGMGSNYIHRLEPGARVRFDGPYGEFSLNQSSYRNIIFVANGTGLSPIMSMLRNLVDAKAKQDIHLYFGLRHVKDIFYQEELSAFTKALPQFKFTICLSQPFPDRWTGPTGRVTILLQQEIKEEMSHNHDVYLCGGLGLIKDAQKIFLNKGFTKDHIFHENFY